MKDTQECQTHSKKFSHTDNEYEDEEEEEEEERKKSRG